MVTYLFRMTVGIIKGLYVPTKRATVIFIKVKSRNALLPVLLLCSRSLLKSVLRYKLLILDICCPDTLYLHEQRYEDP
jgi:hypothetical protein